MAKIVIDRSKCVALGVCESLAPEHFELSEKGDLIVIGGEDVDPADVERVREAVLGCPTEALLLVED